MTQVFDSIESNTYLVSLQMVLLFLRNITLPCHSV